MHSQGPHAERPTPETVTGKSDAAAGPSATPAGPGRTAMLVLPAALLAALAAWALGEPMLETFHLTAEEAAGGAPGFGGQIGAEYLRGRERVATRNAALHYGIFGAALGAAIGLSGGASRRSARGAMLGLSAGFAGGAALGGLASLGLVPVFHANYSQDRPDLALPLLVHGGIGAAIGLGAGAALGLGRGDGRARVASAALGAAFGAVLGTAVAEVAHAVAFPLSRSEAIIPSERPARLMAHLLVAGGVPLGAAVALRGGARGRPKTESRCGARGRPKTESR